MNQTFRTASALLRHTWLIDESYAHAHEPLINAFLSGNYPLAKTDDGTPPSDEKLVKAFALAGSVTPGQPTRFALDDPNLPDGSVLILEIKGAIFREGFCGSAGSLDYARTLNQSYENEKIIGTVQVVDCPGGQVAGISSFYDAVADPRKPVVSLVHEGVMASAAYWFCSPSDFIMASQKADQIGSIGVMCRLRDTKEYDQKMGIKNVSVYSSRSGQKNKPLRDAENGDYAALEADLDQTADLFREAVEAGRGDRLKPVKKGGPDVFEGGLFYASKALELGLIDGFGNLDAAVAKVVELHQARQGGGSTSAVGASASQTLTPATSTPPLASTDAPGMGDLTPPAAPAAAEANTENSPTQNPETNMFGFTKLPALAAVKGIASADVTAEQITAINAELEANGFALAVISETDFTAAQTVHGQLTTAQNEVTRLTAEVARLGKQPGTTPTTSAKTEEITNPGTSEATTYISETDAMLARLKGGK